MWHCSYTKINTQKISTLFTHSVDTRKSKFDKQQQQQNYRPFDWLSLQTFHVHVIQWQMNNYQLYDRQLDAVCKNQYKHWLKWAFFKISSTSTRQQKQQKKNQLIHFVYWKFVFQPGKKKKARKKNTLKRDIEHRPRILSII